MPQSQSIWVLAHAPAAQAATDYLFLLLAATLWLLRAVRRALWMILISRLPEALPRVRTRSLLRLPSRQIRSLECEGGRSGPDFSPVPTPIAFIKYLGPLPAITPAQQLDLLARTRAERASCASAPRTI